MADNKTVAVRNVTRGIRGLNTVSGYRDLDPGEYVESVELTAAEYASAERTRYFAFGTAAKKDPAEATDDAPAPRENPTDAAAGSAPPSGAVGGGSTDELDKMDDATLRTTTAALTGKAESSLPKDREKLLALARGQA